MARELGCGDLIKIEVIQDQMYLMPDNLETIRAAEVLAKGRVYRLSLYES